MLAARLATNDASPPAASASPPLGTTCGFSISCRPLRDDPGGFTCSFRLYPREKSHLSPACYRSLARGLLNGAALRCDNPRSHPRNKSAPIQGVIPTCGYFSLAIAIIVTSTHFASHWIARSWPEVPSREVVRMPQKWGRRRGLGSLHPGPLAWRAGWTRPGTLVPPPLLLPIWFNGGRRAIGRGSRPRSFPTHSFRGQAGQGKRARSVKGAVSLTVRMPEGLPPDVPRFIIRLLSRKVTFLAWAEP